MTAQALIDEITTGLDELDQEQLEERAGDLDAVKQAALDAQHRVQDAITAYQRAHPPEIHPELHTVLGTDERAVLQQQADRIAELEAKLAAAEKSA